MDDRQRINKQPTSAAQGGDETQPAIAGNVREKGQDPSPDDRDRGERSGRERPGSEERDRR